MCFSCTDGQTLLENRVDSAFYVRSACQCLQLILLLAFNVPIELKLKMIEAQRLLVE